MIIKVLAPIKQNPYPVPTPPKYEGMVIWQEGQAQVDAYNANKLLVMKYNDVTFYDWLSDYNDGRVAWDAPPPKPPIQKYAQVMEDELPAGAVPTPFVSPNGTTTQVTWTLVPDPNGVLVCDVPHYDMRPQPPLDRLLDALPPLEFQDQTVLVPLVSIGQSTKSLDQHTVWVRIQ